jgi:hypothetical protein
MPNAKALTIPTFKSFLQIFDPHKKEVGDKEVGLIFCRFVQTIVAGKTQQAEQSYSVKNHSE